MGREEALSSQRWVEDQEDLRGGYNLREGEETLCANVGKTFA